MRGLAPVQFLLWQGQKLVTGYQAIERRITEPMSVGFVLCLDSGIFRRDTQKRRSSLTGLPRVETAGALLGIRQIRVDSGTIACSSIDGAGGVSAGRRRTSEKHGRSTHRDTLGFGDARRARVAPAGCYQGAGQAASDPIGGKPVRSFARNGSSGRLRAHEQRGDSCGDIRSPCDSLKSICQRTEGFVVEAADASELAATYHQL